MGNEAIWTQRFRNTMYEMGELPRPRSPIAIGVSIDFAFVVSPSLASLSPYSVSPLPSPNLMALHNRRPPRSHVGKAYAAMWQRGNSESRRGATRVPIAARSRFTTSQRPTPPHHVDDRTLTRAAVSTGDVQASPSSAGPAAPVISHAAHLQFLL